jgi:hypothetical protein
MRNLRRTTVSGLFSLTAPIPPIQACAGNSHPSVLSSCWGTRFTIGFSFQATVPALRQRLSTRATCCCDTIHASAESLNQDGEAASNFSPVPTDQEFDSSMTAAAGFRWKLTGNGLATRTPIRPHPAQPFSPPQNRSFRRKWREPFRPWAAGTSTTGRDGEPRGGGRSGGKCRQGAGRCRGNPRS